MPMRDKERLQDYRFMAEPNLPPIVLQEGHSTSPHMLSIEEIRAQLPELRPLTVQRLLGYGLSAEHVGILMVSIALPYIYILYCVNILFYCIYILSFCIYISIYLHCIYILS